jgi:hypothetical protein
MAITPNTLPNFTQSANISSVAVTAANTSSEGGGTVGTNIFLAYSPGANDSYVDFLRWMPTASAAGTNTTATVGRVFISSVNSGATTSANTFLIYEVVLPQVSADSASGANNPIDVPLGFRLPGSNAAVGAMYLLVTNHAAPATSTQWVTTTFGANY